MEIGTALATLDFDVGCWAVPIALLKGRAGLTPASGVAGDGGTGPKLSNDRPIKSPSSALQHQDYLQCTVILTCLDSAPQFRYSTECVEITGTTDVHRVRNKDCPNKEQSLTCASSLLWSFLRWNPSSGPLD